MKLYKRSVLGKLQKISERLERIELVLSKLIKEEVKFMADMQMALADLTAQVQADTDAENAAITLINGIAARIAAAAGDPTQVIALTQILKDSAAKLGAAVVANTPASNQ